jgi:hypothetical protein
MATRAAAKKTPPPDDGPAPLNIADLPDNKGGQITEAMEQPTPFVLRDGSTLLFKPVVDWPFRATQAFLMGDMVGWARGVLDNPDDLDRFMDQGQRDVGRIIRYFDDRQGSTRGEGSSSSTS